MNAEIWSVLVVVVLLACCVGPMVLMAMRGRRKGGPGEGHAGPPSDGTGSMTPDRPAWHR